MELLNSKDDASDLLLIADAAMGSDDVDPCNELSSVDKFRARSCSAGCSEVGKRATGDIFRISERRIDGMRLSKSDELKLLSIAELLF